ncbi:ubiquitin carboxyl-terminal hydrolase 10 isoform X2 [Bufo gargarizans]|uniref:ubiquitin carboxyl-terminal hydrolase 10 isoform X2 n=1 Tax=Bufo gargarizans TaxID=30331 RepID=UPI001CF19A39|nr:ubiquitin carboxyl-terminal hydrolase 10 isoform X2 [Bufo gargarizans]
MRSSAELGRRAGRRWRRRGKRHERPHSLKVSSMASPGAQYVFGEFTDDEFRQFFTSSRCTVELPPFNETILCGPQSSCDLHDGDEYQRIEFGVSEVIDPDAAQFGNSGYSISSTLNPQAPEFILACSPTQKTPDILLTNNLNDDDGQYHETIVPDGSGSAENDGTCRQKERKKKKKRPPGYYSYLEGVDGGGAPEETLVNGHATSAGLDSISTDEPELSEDVRASSASPRSCYSPEISVDFRNEAVDDDSTSVPNALDNGRTAGQPEECSSSDNGRESPLRTAEEQPLAVSDTTEKLGVTNGQTLEATEDTAASNGVDLHPEAEQVKPEDTSSSQAVNQASLLAPGNPPAKSWASLFHSSKPSPTPLVAYVETKPDPPPADPPAPEKQVDINESPVPVTEDAVAIKIAELLDGVKLIHKPVSLQPRGLINKGNWCYINATLQALVACPPLYHLMKCIPVYTKLQRPCTSTPMIDSFVRLMNEFSNMPVIPKAKPAVAGDKVVRDLRPGPAFEPTFIYQLLTVSKSTLSDKGRQEDAEEYLGFVLNGLHEEMLCLKKLLYPQSDILSFVDEENSSISCRVLGPQWAEISNGPDTQPANDEGDTYQHGDQAEGSDEEWEQVGPRNKSSITRQADFVQTPITDIFGGHMRSVVYQQSSKESATLQPFFTLQLDIQSDKIRTVQDALESLVARESVQGYTTKTKQEVEVSRRVTLEELPPVLVLHLKRFVFEKTGGCQKLTKNIEYPVDLEISKELLSPGMRSKIFKGQKTYRLFAVVYHHGNSATGGHYTTDVFQIGLNGWLRIDDQTVKVINQYQVVKQTVERTAYLLYYRRVDLL